MAPGQTSVRVMHRHRGPGAGAVVLPDLDEQPIDAAGRVGQAEEVVIADAQLARRDTERRRRHPDRPPVHVCVARLVLGEQAASTAVRVGDRIISPARVVDRNPALPVAAAGPQVHGRPAQIGLEIVAEGNVDTGRRCRGVHACGGVGRVSHGGTVGGDGADVVGHLPTARCRREDRVV